MFEEAVLMPALVSLWHKLLSLSACCKLTFANTGKELFEATTNLFIQELHGKRNPLLPSFKAIPQTNAR
jgi:hypothetical protein